MRPLYGRASSAATGTGYSDESPRKVGAVENTTEAAGLLRAEADDNASRKDLTPTEAWARKAREALLTPLAKAAMSEGGKGG